MPTFGRKRNLRASELLPLTSVTDFSFRGKRGENSVNVSISGALVKDLPIFPEISVQNLKHFVAMGLISTVCVAYLHTWLFPLVNNNCTVV